jgi:hypothetical protein
MVILFIIPILFWLVFLTVQLYKSNQYIEWMHKGIDNRLEIIDKNFNENMRVFKLIDKRLEDLE